MFESDVIKWNGIVFLFFGWKNSHWKILAQRYIIAKSIKSKEA